MKQGFFVTGTDTNVGKTVVSAALLCALRRKHNVCYWKPVQTGIETDDDTREVTRLANCQEAEIYNAGYRLEKPLSPHLSARLAGVSIKISDLIELWKNAPDDKFWLIEGAGGVFVPLNETELMIDLMAKLNLPVIIAARSGLGTINHTLLTVEALRNRNLQVFGVMMNGEPNLENKKAIEHYGGVKVIGELPHLEKLNFETLQAQDSFFV